MIDAHGELKEWAHCDHEERYDHRHASQLYGAYPGDEIQPELTPELYKAAFISNRMRALGNESCHGVMHRAQAAARLKDRHLVNDLLRFTLESGYVTDAFTTSHNPYVKHPFPDGQGELRGMAARAFAHVDELKWNFDNGYISLKLTALTDTTITLCCRAAHTKLAINGKVAAENDALYCDVSLKAGESVCAAWRGVALQL